MKKIYLYSLVLLIIVILAAVLIYSVGSVGGTTSLAQLVSYDNKPVPSGLLSQLNVPNSVSSAIGIGVANKYITKINGTLLTLNGKPEILYVGAEYCPYCAAERWAMIIALMRFGNFTNLHLMTSSSTDYSPSTPTFDFYNSTYTSNYVSFITVEETTNTKAPLQTPNSSEDTILSNYDPSGGIPFLFFAGKYVWISANYDPYSVLYQRNWSAIAAQLDNASSVQAQAIVGTANLMTAQICKVDNNTAPICSQPYVTNIESSIS